MDHQTVDLVLQKGVLLKGILLTNFLEINVEPLTLSETILIMSFMMRLQKIYDLKTANDINVHHSTAEPRGNLV